jgi:hypothetical protein
MTIVTELIAKFTLTHSVIVTWVLFQIMGEFTILSCWANIFIVKFLTCLFFGLRSNDLSADVVREMAMHSIFAVACKIVNTRIQKSIYMISIIFALDISIRSWTFLNSKVLLRAKILNS